MAEPIIYIDRSEIREGKLHELKKSLEELVEFVHTREPRLLSYSFYIDDTGTRMTLVAIYPDSASLEFHMEVAGPAFGKLAHLVNLLAIEIYGRPSEKALEQLRGKARLLGSGEEPVVDGLHTGFWRYTSA